MNILFQNTWKQIQTYSPRETLEWLNLKITLNVRMLLTWEYWFYFKQKKKNMLIVFKFELCMNSQSSIYSCGLFDLYCVWRWKWRRTLWLSAEVSVTKSEDKTNSKAEYLGVTLSKRGSVFKFIHWTSDRGGSVLHHFLTSTSLGNVQSTDGL